MVDDMIVTHRRQPTDRSCGQTILAMLTHVEPSTVIARMGDRGTTPTDLIAYLSPLGFRLDTRLRLTRKGRPLPPRAVLRFKWNGEAFGHWILWFDRMFHDPASEFPLAMPGDDPWDGSMQATGGRITSYLKIDHVPDAYRRG